MNRTRRSRWRTRCFALLVPLTSCALMPLPSAMAQVPSSKVAPPETTQLQPPPNNWLTVSSPGTRALATPESFLQYGPPPDGLCCPGKKSGSCIHRLIEWASYCPKYRVGCSPCCNSCQYKGVLPIHLIMMTPPCVCGSGLHATFPNQCYKGCQGCNTCAAGSAHAGN